MDVVVNFVLNVVRQQRYDPVYQQTAQYAGRAPEGTRAPSCCP